MDDFGLIDIDAPLPEQQSHAAATIQLSSSSQHSPAPTQPPPPPVPLTPQLPPLEAVPDLHIPSPLPLPPSSTSTIQLDASFSSSSSPPASAAAAAPHSSSSISFDPPVLSAPSSRFLDLLTPLRERPPTDAIASNADVISLTSDELTDDPSTNLRTQLAQYKRRKVELSTARATLSSLQRGGGEEFIDLKQFSAPPPRPTPPPSSSHSTSSSLSSSAPWQLRSYLHTNFTLRLHEELLDFAAFISPTSSEEKQRASLLWRFSSLIRSLFPSSSLAAFGSYATKLYLPMSDIDVVVFDTPDISFDTGETALEVIAEALRREGWASYLEVISNARIPIVKFTDKETGLKVDVCRDQQSGLNAAKYVTSMAIKLPAFRPLILFLKYFLYTRRLNDTYTGGIGSYLLQLLLLSHLHCHPSQTSDVNLGLLLLSFFDLYGHQLNYAKVGVSLNPPSYYSKDAKQRYNPQRPFLLSVENPLDVEHDVGVNSFCVMKVRRAFQFAFAQLTRKEVMEGMRAGSLLALLVRGDEPILAMRGEKKRREVERRKIKQQREQEEEGAVVSMDEEKAEHQPPPFPQAEEKEEGEIVQVVRSRKVVKKVKAQAAVDDAKRGEEASSAALEERPRDRSRRGDAPSPLVRWYQEKRTEWLHMPSVAAMQWLKKEGLSKAERAQLRQFKKERKRLKQQKAQARESGEPTAESIESPVIASASQPQREGLGALAKSKELLDWYTTRETQWMSMPIDVARAFLQERGLSQAERTALEALHGQNLGKTSEEVKDRGPAEVKEGSGAAEEGRKEVKEAARPAWLDLDRGCFAEFLEKEVVVASVQRAMRKTWKEERRRVKEAKRRRNPELVDKESEHQEKKRRRTSQPTQATLDSLWGTEATKRVGDDAKEEEGQAADKRQSAAPMQEKSALAAESPGEQQPAMDEPRTDGSAQTSPSPPLSAPSSSLPTAAASPSSPSPTSATVAFASKAVIARVSQTMMDEWLAAGHSAAEAASLLKRPSSQVELRYRVLEEKTRVASEAHAHSAHWQQKVVVHVREQMMQEAQAKAEAEGRPAPTRAIFLDADVQAEQNRRVVEEKQHRAELLQRRTAAAKARAGKATASPAPPAAANAAVDVIDLSHDNQPGTAATTSAKKKPSKKRVVKKTAKQANGEFSDAAPPPSQSPAAPTSRSSSGRQPTPVTEGDGKSSQRAGKRTRQQR